MSDHLNEEILQRQRADFQGCRRSRRGVEDIAGHKPANRLPTDDVQTPGGRLHIFLQPAPAVEFGETAFGKRGDSADGYVGKISPRALPGEKL